MPEERSFRKSGIYRDNEEILQKRERREINAWGRVVEKKREKQDEILE